MIPFIQENIGGTYGVVYQERTYNVYFLQSTTSNKTYVGYTNNPFRRIKEHNEGKGKGAKRTKGNQWRIVCVISGFPTTRAALQFEFCWHELRASRKRIKNGPDGRYRYRKCPRIIGCSDGLNRLFTCQWTSTAPAPRSFPLTLIWNVEGVVNTYQWSLPRIDFSCWRVYQGFINFDSLIT
ncbi:MAG: structure-specific endonuclease subunit [Solivirus sp.]|uniref:Structure-specific endonuclease subunit n=1 Tax=Solivirus sp. TaxID=2487772 RepID=A0A3G5AFE3_9VIRU|nr:MAG: structure-specific endonuclease subunit [Solivirus sp.]